jgi:hypothetical protein
MVLTFTVMVMAIRDLLKTTNIMVVESIKPVMVYYPETKHYTVVIGQQKRIQKE